MKKYKVLLYDEEEVFVVALMNYINRNSKIPILILAFTNLEEVKSFLCVHRPDLIVIGKKTKINIFETELSIPILWIVEEKKESDEIDNRDSVIARYSSASAYVHKMLQILNKEKRYIGNEEYTACIAVYSPIGRCGTTSLAHGLCKTFAMNSRYGRASICLGWEEFATEFDENRRMEECLYYIKQRSDDISIKMKALAIETDGYNRIPSAVNYQELRELSREDLKWLFECIRREGYYDFLVADVGSACLSSLELLAEFDVIYLPYLQDVHTEQKLRQFALSMQELAVWETFSEKCYPVLIGKEVENLEEYQQMEQLRKRGDLRTIKQVVTCVEGTDL